MTRSNLSRPGLPLFESHPRAFQDNRYVYPVLSRRAGGISIGVNLNLDKVCNFHCVYCQVDRGEPRESEFVEIGRLVAELDATIGLITSGRIYDDAKFAQTPQPLRRLNDIAFSGDAEPTTYRNFDEVVEAVARALRAGVCQGDSPIFPAGKLGQSPSSAAPKLVLITNASMLHRDRVRRALEILDENNGEIWAKLDAGTEEFYRRINRSSVRWQRILENITAAAIARPIVIQSLVMRIEGQAMPRGEQEAYGDRLREIVAAGGRIKQVQLYTVARPPAESWVSALTDAELDAMADLVRRRTGLGVDTFYGARSNS